MSAPHLSGYCEPEAKIHPLQVPDRLVASRLAKTAIYPSITALPGYLREALDPFGRGCED